MPRDKVVLCCLPNFDLAQGADTVPDAVVYRVFATGTHGQLRLTIGAVKG